MANFPRVAPRSAIPCAHVVLGPGSECLAKTLKRIKKNSHKGRLDNHWKQGVYLANLLSRQDAVWHLVSFELSEIPGEVVSVEAYVLYVDLICRNEVSFKITKKSIDDLAAYYRHFDTRVSIGGSCNKTQPWESLRDGFVTAIEQLIYCVPATSVLNYMNSDGAGSLPHQIGQTISQAISGLMKPTLPVHSVAGDVGHCLDALSQDPFSVGMNTDADRFLLLPSVIGVPWVIWGNNSVQPAASYL